jgi:hypothetical protein
VVRTRSVPSSLERTWTLAVAPPGFTRTTTCHLREAMSSVFLFAMRFSLFTRVAKTSRVRGYQARFSQSFPPVISATSAVNGRYPELCETFALSANALKLSSYPNIYFHRRWRFPSQGVESNEAKLSL